MKRLMDVLVAALLVATVVVTYRSFTRQKPPAPAPKAPEPANPATSSPPTAPPLAGSQSREELEERLRQLVEQNQALEAEARRLSEERTGGQQFQSGPQQAEARAQQAQWSQDDRLRAVTRVRGGEYPTRDRLSNEPRMSDVDVKRKQAKAELEHLFRSLGPNGRSLIRNAERYVKSCGSVTDGFCVQLLENLGRQAIAVGKQLDSAQELARTSWLPPGEVRALRERHGIDDSMFDQLVRLVRQYGL